MGTVIECKYRYQVWVQVGHGSRYCVWVQVQGIATGIEYVYSWWEWIQVVGSGNGFGMGTGSKHRLGTVYGYSIGKKYRYCICIEVVGMGCGIMYGQRQLVWISLLVTGIVGRCEHRLGIVYGFYLEWIQLLDMIIRGGYCREKGLAKETQ